MKEEYLTLDGNFVSLETLCRMEPHRVVGMIRSLQAQVEYYQQTMISLSKNERYGPPIYLCHDCPNAPQKEYMIKHTDQT